VRSDHADQRAQRHQGKDRRGREGRTVITASITNEAVDELRLTKGETAYAVIKASDVMVGKD
jgi:ABC-type molybdate transport system ATPase subunit